MNLEHEILSVLVKAGNKGLKLEKIARHVYNSCNSIFNPLNYKTIYNSVAQYLSKSAKDPNSIIEKGKGYAVYHINYDSMAVRQLMLNFTSDTTLMSDNESDEENQPKESFLFGDFE